MFIVFKQVQVGHLGDKGRVPTGTMKDDDVCLFEKQRQICSPH